MRRVIGIDLGTTYSVVAVARPGGDPEVLANRDGDRLTPSVVLFQDEGQILVGKTAKNAIKDMPEDAVEFVKRQMGKPEWSFVDSRGVVHKAEEISALILRRLVEDASEALGEEVHDVVITVPAYFDDARRTATKDAAEIAGLDVLRLINEPTAAGIAFGAGGGESGTFLVYDLGGGTFDVTVMRIEDKDLTVISTGGDSALGGFNFDNLLMKHINAEVQGQNGPDLMVDARREAELREKCEHAKHTLSRGPRAKLFFSDAGRNFAVDVTREQFEKLTEPLVRRTADLTDGVIGEAGLSWADIDKVLLVGGSTRMPVIRRMLEELTGRPVDASAHPDEAVALGAAVLAGIESSLAANPHAEVSHRIQDVTSQSLGVVAVEDDLVTEVNSIIIPNNTSLPCKEFQVYETVSHHQRKINLQVTEGDDDDLRYVARVAERPIDLPPGLKKGSKIKVAMSYDIDGVVHIEVFDVTSGRSLGELELDRPNNLDQGQVRTLSEAVQRVDVQ